MKRLPIVWGILILGVAVLVLALLGVPVTQEARAQDIECPPGFGWQRMSGVGCVQEGCFDVSPGISRYGYTGNCICAEGYKACHEPVDYTGFDGSKCGPFCPASRLVACVGPDEACPGEAPQPLPTQGVEPEPTAAAPAPSEGPIPGTTIQDLLDTLETFLAGSSEGPTPGQIAGGGAAIATLLGAWLLGSLLLGAPSAGPSTASPTPAGPSNIEDIYNADPEKFWQCQDIVWARLWNRAPPSSRTNKAKIWAKMQEEGYWQVHQGGMYDPQGAAAKLSNLRDGDIIMFGVNSLPNVQRANHYAIVENGRIYQILNFTYPGATSGEPDIVDLGDAMTFFQPRTVQCLKNGKTYNAAAYYGFRVFRK